MKCDGLKPIRQGSVERGDYYVYDAEDVDAAIAELKAKLNRAIAERDGNQVCIDALKAKLESVQASAYAESVDAGMRERRLRRALYKACANWAHSRVYVRLNTDEQKWMNVERKCQAKAEGYR